MIVFALFWHHGLPWNAIGVTGLVLTAGAIAAQEQGAGAGPADLRPYAGLQGRIREQRQRFFVLFQSAVIVLLVVSLVPGIRQILAIFPSYEACDRLIIHDHLNVDISCAVIWICCPATCIAGPVGNITLVIIVKAFW